MLYEGEESCDEPPSLAHLYIAVVALTLTTGSDVISPADRRRKDELGEERVACKARGQSSEMRESFCRRHELEM